QASNRFALPQGQIELLMRYHPYLPTLFGLAKHSTSLDERIVDQVAHWRGGDGRLFQTVQLTRLFYQ
ncbi:MAG: hypothetical protein ACOH2T_29155, partial [Pseudomonas sp.]